MLRSGTGFYAGTRIDLPPDRVVSWGLVLTEQAILLLLGGGTLTWVVRRERRRAEAAA